MKEYSIGYRLKFDSISPEDIEDFITQYLRLFNRYEIKITEKLISSGNIELILNLSEKKAKGKYSIHALKNVLNDSQEYIIMVNLINMLRKIDILNEVYIVVHIPYNSFQYLSKVLEISNLLPKNYIILLENVVLKNCNEEYLKQINNLCGTLDEKNIKNIGICLDIGHLLYGCSREDISESRILFKIQEMPNLLSRLKQIHIHDYMERDHLQLNTGLMNLKLVSKFIKKNDITVPIIIESTVRTPDSDGITQVKIMEELLSNS